MRSVCGLIFHFIAIGIWFIVLSVLIGWSVFLALPTIAITFLLGYTFSSYTKTIEWPGFVDWSGWKYLRTNVFCFRYDGTRLGLDTLDFHYKNPVIWAIYPHGHYALTATLAWALDPVYRLRGARGAVHKFLFYIPFLNSLMGWIGAIDASPESMRNTLLIEKKSIYMCPGGVADITNRGNVVVKRSGFLRIARECNTPVVPVWCPDERSYYRHWGPISNWTNSFIGFPFPTFIIGRWWCPLLPILPRESRILLGDPITWDDGKTVEEASDQYWKALGQLQEQASG